jgi:hypothetical protein
VGREMSELKAAAEPRLISDRRQQTEPTKNNARIGTWRVRWIYTFVSRVIALRKGKTHVSEMIVEWKTLVGCESPD